MKTIITIFFLIAAFIVSAGNTHAGAQDEKLKQLTAQLQGNPNNTALREEIIKLVLTMKPEPTVPEEAERRMARGAAAFKSAKNENDYKDAVKEFEQASLAAPWSGDIYYNLGLAQDKAGDHVSAIRNLKLALMASPNSRETKTLLYEVEYRADKALEERNQRVAFEGVWSCGSDGSVADSVFVIRRTGYSQWEVSFEYWHFDGKKVRYPRDRVKLDGEKLVAEMDGQFIEELKIDGGRLFTRSLYARKNLWSEWSDMCGTRKP